MMQLLWISLSLLSPSFLSAGEVVKHSTTKIVAADSSSNKLSDELERKYPFSKWKSIGFCDSQKQPIMTIKVPDFVSWDQNCVLHNVRDGIEYCGPDDSSPRLTGRLNLGGKEHILQVGMEAFSRKKPIQTYYDLSLFNDWKEHSALLSSREILLDGHKAYRGEIEDANNTLPKPTKIMTLIYFNRPYVGGTLYFIELEKKEQAENFVRHKNRIFQKLIEKIIDSFRFKLKSIEDCDLVSCK
jgi:hypothetical protein